MLFAINIPAHGFRKKRLSVTYVGIIYAGAESGADIDEGGLLYSHGN